MCVCPVAKKTLLHFRDGGMQLDGLLCHWFVSMQLDGLLCQGLGVGVGAAVLANKASGHFGRTGQNGVCLCGKPATCILAALQTWYGSGAISRLRCHQSSLRCHQCNIAADEPSSSRPTRPGTNASLSFQNDTRRHAGQLLQS